MLIWLSLLRLGRDRVGSSSVKMESRGCVSAEFSQALQTEPIVRDLFRSLPLVLLVLAVPIVPFVLFGGRVDEWFEAWQAQARNPWLAAAMIVGLLSTDIFLPIPSSMVSTFGGGQLGWLLGTFASWLGMSIGAILGFAFARWLGPGFTRWFVKRDSLTQMSQLSERFGPSIVVLARGVPVLAEASVLLLGLERLSWRKFLPPLLLSNLGLALAYSAFGDFAQQYNSVPLALAISILLPVLVAAVVQRRLHKSQPESV